MLKNNNNDNFFEDDSYRDSYENMSGDDLFGEEGGSVLDGFDNTNSFGAQNFNQQGFNQQNFNQQTFNQQQYQQGMNSQQIPQEQYQQVPQSKGAVQEIAGKILENGGIKLKSSHVGIAIIVLAVIVVMVIFGIHGLMNKPKTVRTQSQSQTTVTQKANNSKSVGTSSVDTLNLIVVEDNVPIDYTSMKLSTTGLVTNKQTFVVDNQLVYCLDISMTVGNGTKTIHHFCNRTIFTAIETGTVVNVTYQQVDEHNIAVYDITTTN